MRRNYYSDYVEHCMRLYARNPELRLLNGVQKRNMSAVDTVLNRLSQNDREMVVTIFREADTIADNVYEYSKVNGLQQNSVWKIVNHTMREVAAERGLI